MLVGAVQPLPFGRREGPEGRAPARQPRRPPQGGRLGGGDRAGQGGREPADRRDRPRGRGRRDAARREAARPGDRRLPALGRDRAPRSPRAAAADAPAARSAIDLDQGRRFWSFLPAAERPLPTVSDPRWSRNRIDPFVLRGLDDHGMRPSPEADRRTLIRRVTFDLTGLSPTPEEVEAFLADAAAGRLRAAGRPAARLAPPRRAVGPVLARRGPLRRGQPDRRGHQQGPAEPARLPRLGHPGPQRRPPLRRVRPPPARRRPDAGPPPVGAGRARVHRPGAGLPQGAEALGRGDLDDRGRRVGRAGRHRHPGLPGPDRRLRPVPRPQVRPDRRRPTTTPWPG